MTELEIYQNYWWLLISLLAGILVFMLFVQGGQTMLFSRLNQTQKQLIVNSLGRKWELGFTSLVVFGGAFFASFPLYYSTSFGGAYWLWMTILLSFVIQAAGYEFRRKRGNIFGKGFYDGLLFINGVVGCVMLGAAVGMMFFGAPFSVDRFSLAGAGNNVISTWAPTHGLEVMASWKCLLLGFTILFLSRTMGALYFLFDIRATLEFETKMRKEVLGNGVVFVLLFLAFTAVLLTTSSVRYDPISGWQIEANLYFHNFIHMWGWGLTFLCGVILVLTGIFAGGFSNYRKGFWVAGAGVVAVIVALFAVMAYDGTSYLPSTTDISSSLTLADSSSSLFTMKVMTYVSFLLPIVIGYIALVWRKMNRRPMEASDVSESQHQY